MKQDITQAEAAEELLRRRAARGSLAAYMDYVSGRKPPPHIDLLCQKLEDCLDRKVKRLLVCLPPGHMKALALDTPIATPSGWSTMGELKVGDYVFDENGQPTRVTAKSSIWKDRPVHRVLTKDGEEIVADEDHEWPVRLCRKHKRTSLRTTKWLSDRDRRITDSRRAMIQIAGPLNLPTVALPIDPYVLGAWLGDGTSSCGNITTADQFIVDEMVKREGCVKRHGKTGNAASTYHVGPNMFDGARPRETLHHRLRLLGVLKNKHIPQQYMFASHAQRLALLQGLMDTDGTVSKAGQALFCNTNETLIYQVRDLVFSLGVKASISESIAKVNGKECGPVYFVSFYKADACLMPRKRVLCKDGKKYNNRYIRVEPCGTADTVCIEVDTPSHLFLAGRSLLPTHNSFTVSHHFPAFYLSKFPDHNVIAATHTESFSETWGRKVRNLMMGTEHRSVFPHAQIAEDSRAASRWDLVTGGSYFATGVGGAVTGKRADCLTGDTVVQTQAGPLTLAEIHRMHVKPRVLAYDHTHQHLDWCDVVASRMIAQKDTIRISTFSGHRLQCTPDHRIARKTDGDDEYIAASDLSVGDRIHVVSDGPVREHSYETINYVGLCDTSDVYDLQVREHHNFIANGILVHNCVILDDLLRGVEDANSANVRESMWNWFGSDLSTRLKPGAIMCFVTTRWHLDDLAGRLQAAEHLGGDKWEKLILPAIAENNDPLGRVPGTALWPDVYDLALLENIKSQPAMTDRQWKSLYQQDPVGEDGGLIKRSWFKPWRYAEPPKCDYVIQSWDTALSTSDISAYSACTTWGVFEEPETKLPAMILLASVRGRLLFPDLRALAQRVAWNYMDDNLLRPKLNPVRMSPDQILVEDRSSGSSLIGELMRAGISTIKVNPTRGGSKDARLAMSTDILENGRVYVPYAPPNFTIPYRYAEELVTELCSFPAAASRDYADSFSQAVDRVKKFGVMRNSGDPYTEVVPRQDRREAYY